MKIANTRTKFMDYGKVYKVKEKKNVSCQTHRQIYCQLFLEEDKGKEIASNDVINFIY